MKQLRVGILDLVSRGPTNSLYARLMHANLASIMPQALAVWCEELGHSVQLVCYTGFTDPTAELPADIDVLFIGAFTQAAQLSYALSNLFRARGVVTVLGGPHARCYPEDAQKYFDYVLGFTDKDTLRAVLEDCRPHRPFGLRLAAAGQPTALPGVRQRWKFIAPILAQAPALKIVPMLGSLGCPYSCPFCIDAAVPYQPFDFDGLRDDLRFLLTRLRHPVVAWHDPNFGVRFDDYLEAIDSAAPPGSIDFIAESSLSLLSEPHLARLRRAGFRALLPGVESWFDLGNKAKTGGHKGAEKVRLVSDHVNMLLRYVPYVQTNFVLGLDSDAGDEPFELTKEFVDRTPAAFPGYSLLSAFGQAAALNLTYQRANRVLGFPFHFLNNHHAMNVRPKNYTWPEFYDRLIDVTTHTFSWRAIARRLAANRGLVPRWMNVVRAVSSEGFGRIRYQREVRRLLDYDRGFRAYFEQETDVLPDFYVRRVKHDLGSLWDWLPAGALTHDARAYLANAPAPGPLAMPGAARGLAAAAPAR